MKKTSLFLLLLAEISCKTGPNSSSPNENSSLRTEAQEPKTERVGLGLNDLSISFPREEDLPGIDAILPRLSSIPNPKEFAPGLPALPDDGEGFVFKTTEAEHFDQMGLPINPVRPNSRRLSRTGENMFQFYKLNGLRFVPCANDFDALGDDSKCKSTMQMTWNGIDDNTFHSIYFLSNDEFKGILAELVKLHKEASIDTERLPLGTHPVILKEGLNSPYFKGINGLIHRYARATRLIGVAAMHAENVGESWRMAQFLAVGKSIKMVPGGDMQIDDRASSTGEAQEMGSEFNRNPFVLARRQPVRFFKGSGLNFKKWGAENRKVMGVNNPRLHSLRTVNCASCHTSGIVGFKSVDPVVADDPLSFKSKYWNLDVAEGNSGAASGINLVMFSRHSISQRVINETASSLNFLVDRGLLPKPKGWDELPPFTQKDVDEPKILVGSSYRLTNPSYKHEACFGPLEGKKEAGTKIAPQKCDGSPSLVYKFQGSLEKLRLVNQNSGLCLTLVPADGTFINAACDDADVSQVFLATGNVHVARFENEASKQCIESTFSDQVNFSDMEAKFFSLFASNCAVSTLSLLPTPAN